VLKQGASFSPNIIPNIVSNLSKNDTVFVKYCQLLWVWNLSDQANRMIFKQIQFFKKEG